MRIYSFIIDTPLIEVVADSPEEAQKKAKDQLEHLSGSNDGSELLANARLNFAGSRECEHPRLRTTVEFGIYKDRLVTLQTKRMSGSNVKFTTVSCPDCPFWTKTREEL